MKKIYKDRHKTLHGAHKKTALGEGVRGERTPLGRGKGPSREKNREGRLKRRRLPPPSLPSTTSYVDSPLMGSHSPIPIQIIPGAHFTPSTSIHGHTCAHHRGLHLAAFGMRPGPLRRKWTAGEPVAPPKADQRIFQSCARANASLDHRKPFAVQLRVSGDVLCHSLEQNWACPGHMRLSY